MNLKYIVNKTYLDSPHCIGIAKKIKSQIKAFRHHKINAEMLFVGDTCLLTKLLPWKTSSYNWKNLYIDKKTDVLYIRYSSADMEFLKFLEKSKKNNRAIKIILELPTYPFDRELAGKGIKILIKKYLLYKDKFFQGYLRKYVDVITTFSEHKEIFGIPTIKIVNGIDFDEVTILKRDALQVATDSVIHCIAVSSMSFWHGYDRIIEGLINYYKTSKTYDIYLHIVGDGPELSKYKENVAKNHLEKKIIFYGLKTGEQLDEIYNLCDIALESLGRHRSGIYLSSSLKSREYAAKGLPIVSSCQIDVFPFDSYPYIKQVDENDMPINVEEIINFYKDIYSNKDKETVHRQIRNTARNYCDMDITIEPIINYILTIQ